MKKQICRTDFEYALVKNRWKNEQYILKISLCTKILNLFDF